jgi:hypothetical protein
MSVCGQRLNEPMRDWSDDPYVRRNPRAFDLAGVRSQRVIQRPPSDRALVERMRADPSLNADEVVARKLPRGVVP